MLGGCGGNDKSAETAGGQAGSAGMLVEVLETMEAGGYTYARLMTVDGPVWTAGPVTPLEVGQKIIASGAMEMRDFYSKTLDRTFDSIYFVQSYSADDGTSGTQEAMKMGHGDVVGGRGQNEKTEDGVEPGVTRIVLKRDVTGEVDRAPEGNTIAEVYRDRAAMSGRTVTVRGIVVTFTPDIMGTNWLHLQDGTGRLGSHDLAVTTNETVSVGELVTVSGVLAEDRDFGSGYKYLVILQGARIIRD
jgi:hypothetical protein